MVLEMTLGAGLLGFLAGFMAGRNQAPKAEPRPMRLVRREFTAPGGPVAQSWSDAELWRLHVGSFAYHGNITGFSYRAMREAGVCRRAAWERYTELLKGAGVIQGAERSATTWAGGWCVSRLNVELRHGRITLPYPSGKPPALNSAKLAAQMAQRSTPGTVGARAGGHAHTH
jgi:hypothetical protein